MNKEIRYTTVRRVLDNLLDHPMLRDVSLEQAVRYTMRFIELHGYYRFYEEKETLLDIKDFRGLLPCDLISIIQVMDIKTGLCLRSMTDTFGTFHDRRDERCDKPLRGLYIPPGPMPSGELTFKTQGRVLFASFPEGKVKVAYQAIPTDDDGFPLLIDNEVYIDCLEAYIKKKVFTVKFDQGKISAGVLENAKQDYAVAAKLLQSEFSTPSVSEMQTLANIWNTLIPQMRLFDRGFKHLGDSEYLRKQ